MSGLYRYYVDSEEMNGFVYAHVFTIILHQTADVAWEVEGRAAKAFLWQGVFSLSYGVSRSWNLLEWTID